MNEVRVGIAGLGSFGELHAAALSSLPYVTLAKVCSRTAARAKEIFERYGAETFCTDYEELACSHDVDAVIVANRGGDHLKVVLPALEAGKHVLVEKPMADTLEDAQAMVSAAESASGAFMVGHICRFQACYLEAKRQVDAGAIGRVVSISARRNVLAAILSPGNLGNPVMEAAIHDIDLAMWIAGADVVESQGYCQHNLSDEVADSYFAQARLANGVICVFESVWLGREGQPADLDAQMKIIGTGGEIEIHQPPRNFILRDGRKSRFLNPEISHDPMLLGQTGLMAEIVYFLKCVMTGTAPKHVTAQDGLRALRAALKISSACRAVK